METLRIWKKEMFRTVGITAISALAIFPDASASDGGIYTLYRTSPPFIDPEQKLRIHIATFDADVEAFNGTRASYNLENCRTAARLFQSQPDVIVLYWCEPGRFRK